MANWAALNHDLLLETVWRIKWSDDFFAFGGVCTSWRSAASMQNFRYKSTQMPWLMLPSKVDRNLRGFFSVTKGATRQVILPKAYAKKCFSSRGFLITIGEDWCISLLHPSSNFRVELPHMKMFKDWDDLSLRDGHISFIRKCLLSASLLVTTGYILMVIHGNIGKLAYFMPGDNVWTTIDTWDGCFFDITYFKEKFYAINSFYKIMACDIKDDKSIEIYPVAQLPISFKPKYLEKLYMLESEGKLLVVMREGAQLDEMKEDESKSNYETYAFQIFEVDLSSNTWKEVKNLGNKALFLGDNSSFSIEVLDVTRCKSNCIYFTDDCRESYCSPDFCGGGGGKDMGIYNIQDKSIEPYIRSNFCELLTPPLWVEQSF